MHRQDIITNEWHIFVETEYWDNYVNLQTVLNGVSRNTLVVLL